MLNRISTHHESLVKMAQSIANNEFTLWKFKGCSLATSRCRAVVALDRLLDEIENARI
jgi:hypothetical protein